MKAQLMDKIINSEYIVSDETRKAVERALSMNSSVLVVGSALCSHYNFVECIKELEKLGEKKFYSRERSSTLFDNIVDVTKRGWRISGVINLADPSDKLENYVIVFERD